VEWVRKNECYKVERELRKGFQHVNLREKDFGETPLVIACSKGYAEMARILLQGGKGACLGGGGGGGPALWCGDIT
jgi:hypothetical protein